MQNEKCTILTFVVIFIFRLLIDCICYF